MNIHSSFTVNHPNHDREAAFIADDDLPKIPVARSEEVTLGDKIFGELDTVVTRLESEGFDPRTKIYQRPSSTAINQESQFDIAIEQEVDNSGKMRQHKI